MTKPVRLQWDAGTLILQGVESALADRLPAVVWDPRTLQWRAEARYYRPLIEALLAEGLKPEDQARRYEKLPLRLQQSLVPREHQTLALQAWQKAGSCGVVSLPTGAGKTILAVMALVATGRPALIMVPTIDLLQQWSDTLRLWLGEAPGMLGGGSQDPRPLTVATYDSAALWIERIGDRYGLLIFDECHHLPAPRYQMIARAALAPFRLGLSATVERPDLKEELIYELIGDPVYQGRISQMTEKVLAPYDVVRVEVPLSDKEMQAYQEARQTYTGFIRRHRISMAGPRGWLNFVRKASYLPGGREALRAHRQQKLLAQGADAKLAYLWEIFRRHPGERIIVFTDQNELAYRIGRWYLLPVLTHKTRPAERRRFLEGFREGELDVLVTSKVLNEGVDVPEASIGVVVSGSSGVREHVQRLGRILRHRDGKTAVLYEIISKDTSEFYVNQRRRQHDAYQGPAQVHHEKGPGVPPLS